MHYEPRIHKQKAWTSTKLYYISKQIRFKWENEKLITLKVLKDLSLYHLHLKIVVGTLSANKHLNKHMRQTVVSNTLASFLSTSFRETFWDTLYVCIWYIYVKNVIDANGFFSIIMHFWKLTQNKLIWTRPLNWYVHTNRMF